MRDTSEYPMRACMRRDESLRDGLRSYLALILEGGAKLDLEGVAVQLLQCKSMELVGRVRRRTTGDCV